MNRIYKVLTLSSLALLAFALGCSHAEILKSITMDPTSVTIKGTSGEFANAVATFPNPADNPFRTKFTALGNVINPTGQEDISNEVTWATNPPGIAIVDSVGNVVPTGNGCGDIEVKATAHRNTIGTGDSDAIIVGTGTLTVQETDIALCNGTTPVLTVAVTGSGSVSGFTNSNTAATTITACTASGGTNCSASVSTGTVVTLDTSVAPTSFSANCTPVSATSCQVTVNSNTIVDVTFP